MKKIYNYYFNRESEIEKSLMKDFAWFWGGIGFLVGFLAFKLLPENVFYGLLGGVLVLPFIIFHSIYKNVTKIKDK